MRVQPSTVKPIGARGFCWWRSVTVTAVALILATHSFATTVEPMTLEAMADHAAQVIDGTITEISCEWFASPRRIVSQITLSNVVYLKGAPATADATFVLAVPGGRIGEWGMRVAGAPEFNLGERWLLFLLPEYRVFPTVGIWAGAFRIVDDASGAARVYGAAGRPIVGLRGEPGATEAQSATESSTELASKCVAAEGARLAPGAAAVASNATTAIGYGEFAKRLTPILDRSRKHALIGRAGRPVEQEFTPTALKGYVGPSVHGRDPTAVQEGRGAPDALRRGTAGKP